MGCFRGSVRIELFLVMVYLSRKLIYGKEIGIGRKIGEFGFINK